MTLISATIIRIDDEIRPGRIEVNGTLGKTRTKAALTPILTILFLCGAGSGKVFAEGDDRAAVSFC